MTRSFTLSVAAAALACACGTPPTEHFYTLIGDAPALVSTGSGPSVNIASISLPEAVDRNEMVLHKGPNSVALMETRRWAESLKSAIPRVVANDLAPLIDSAAVSTADDNIGQNAKYLVRLDITRFDTSLGGTEAIDVAWVIHPASGAPDAKGKAALRVPARGGDFDDAVAAHSQALAQLSSEIAKQIKGLEKGGN